MKKYQKPVLIKKAQNRAYASRCGHCGSECYAGVRAV